MIGEQEAVRGRLFTIQDVMQSTVRAWLQVFFTSMIGSYIFLEVYDCASVFYYSRMREGIWAPCLD